MQGGAQSCCAATWPLFDLHCLVGDRRVGQDAVEQRQVVSDGSGAAGWVLRCIKSPLASSGVGPAVDGLVVVPVMGQCSRILMQVRV